MGLFEFRKPKWRHKDPAVRLESIESIEPQDIEVLATLIGEDEDREVRQAAINRLADLAELDRLADSLDTEDLSVITARKDSLLYDLVEDSPDTEQWSYALAQISSFDLLAKLAVNGSKPDIRIAAVDRIEDQFLLAGIVQQNCGKKPAMAAMAKIIDEGLLADLVESAASKTSRRLAKEKIAEIERQRNKLSQEEIVSRKLNALVAEVDQLRTSGDIDAAALRLIAIKQEWQESDSQNNHPVYSSFRRVCDDFDARYREILGHRRKERGKADKYEQVRARQDEICSTVERLSCVTTGDAEALKEQAVADWKSLAEDPDYTILESAILTKRFTNSCQVFDTNRTKINLEKEVVEAVEKQCDEAQKLLVADELSKAAACLANAEKYLEGKELKFFNRAVIEKLVSDTSADLGQAKKDVRDRNLSTRQEICTQLERLADSEKPGQIAQQLEPLKQAWQQLAKLEGAEGLELEQRYQKNIIDLGEKLQTLEHEQDWRLWANLSQKEKLVERVATLDQQEDMETVVRVIKESQVEWKKIGPVPHKKSQELWDAFQSGCNRNFERTAPYREELKTRRAEAMERRREICVLTSELAESKDWRKTTAAIKGFQEEWKTLLHGSRREEQKLYQKFRKSCDRFFERRKEHYEQKDEERSRNFVEKEKICEKAEQLAAEPQLDHPKKFQRLQADWRKIGPVPRKKESGVWKRFRAACDGYFNWLEAEQQRNLKQKEELCEMVEKLVAESAPDANQKELAAQVTGLQQQWKEIGPVPRDQSDAIWKRFRKPCDLFFKARHQQFEKEEKERRKNQSLKEELLARAEDLASQGTGKEIAEQLQELQKEWFSVGTAPREINSELNDRFKAVCDAFFEGRRQYFTDLKAQQLENQKQKEGLCLRLENILGTSYKSEAKGGGRALSLAEELKLTMEDNFMLAGRRNEKEGIHDEVKRIEQDWEKIGPVPYKQMRTLIERYRKALEAYYKNRRSRST